MIKSSIVFKNSKVKLFSVLISKALFNIVSEPLEVLFSNNESEEALLETKSEVKKGELQIVEAVRLDALVE